MLTMTRIVIDGQQLGGELPGSPGVTGSAVLPLWEVPGDTSHGYLRMLYSTLEDTV